MKIAVIGSSHTVALKTGWSSLKGELSGQMQPTFFGVGANFVPNFGLEDGVWRTLPELGEADVLDLARKQSKYINGVTELNLNLFDAVCMVGFEAGVEMMLRLIPQIQVGFSTETMEDRPEKTLVSHETFAGLQSDVLSNALKKWPLASLIYKPIFLMPPPLLFEKFLDVNIGGPIGLKMKAEIDRNPYFADWIAAYRSRMVDAFLTSHNVVVLSQQAETIAPCGILSNNEFSHGATRLNGDPQLSTDFGHGNADYGAIFWRSFARQILAL